MSQPISIEVQIQQLGIESTLPGIVPTISIMVGDTSTNWSQNNPMLLKGQIGYETDTIINNGNTRTFLVKVFDGINRWNDLPYTILGLSPTNSNVDWNSIQGKPTAFPPSAHTHPWDQITDKPDTFLPATHEHVINDIIGLAAELMNKADRDQTVNDIQDLRDNKADLVDGFIPSSQIPAFAISEFLGDVASQSAMLELGAQRTDTCFRTDLNQWFYAISDVTNHPSGWRPITAPASGVISINGQTGVVILSKADLGLGNVPNIDATQRSNHQGTQLAATISDFAGATLQVTLTGFSEVAPDSVIQSDSTLTAFQKLQAQIKNKRNIASRNLFSLIEQDFLALGTSQYANLISTAISSGTQVSIAGTPGHPGIIALSDSATANGGFIIGTSASALLLAGGEKATFVFQDRNTPTRATAFIRMGFSDSGTSVEPTDGCYFVIQGGIIRGRCRSNAVQTDTASTFTITANTWYTGEIIVQSASSVLFRLLAENGTLLWSQTVTTNIPTATGRETGFSAMVWETTTDAAAQILWLDYMLLEIDRTLAR